ncbi:MAG TPA: ATP-binding protein [Bryobacteraceae bacterium]|nr:ATP-binding protein [Bryobacteraceae bacterium]
MEGNERSVVENIPPSGDLLAKIDRLTRRNSELEQWNAMLMGSHQDLERFVFAVSHDLQEPIRTISPYTQLLAEKYRGRLDEDAGRFIGNILNGATRARELLAGLLGDIEVARPAEEGAEPVDLNDVLGLVRANLKTFIAENNAAVTSEPLPILRASLNDLITLFQNLIANAIKYRSGEAPRVHVSTRRGGGQILVTVCDNGIGIDPKHHKQIFEPFRRLHGTSVPGAGLGLAVCQRVIKRYEGHIWVESEPGHGATFLFTLPESVVAPG